MIGIYMYENKLNHKQYIGQSTNIARRKEEHLKWPSKYSHFDQELKIIGEQGFNFSILEECTVDQLDEREIYWIEYYNSKENGYNLIAGGQNYRGESNPASKLTEDQVRDIIDKLRDTTIPIQTLAKEYKVHYNTISDINRVKTWNWLHNYKNNIRLEARGSLHCDAPGSNTVLTENIAKQIIEDIKYSKDSLAGIAREYKLNESAVYDINRCRTWKYLHNFKHNIRREFKEGSDDKR